MLCFGRVCAFPCAFNVSAALQGAYITPFPTEVVRAIRTQRDEAYVSKIVCYLHVMASSPHPPPCAFPCALNVSAALQGAYNRPLACLRRNFSGCFRNSAVNCDAFWNKLDILSLLTAHSTFNLSLHCSLLIPLLTCLFTADCSFHF